MIYNIVFTVEAQVDIDEIALWYLNISGHLSLRFLNDLEIALNKIIDEPLLSFKDSKSVYKRRLAVFPYNVYLRIDKTSIVVAGVIQFKRHSRVLKKRLK